MVLILALAVIAASTTASVSELEDLSPSLLLATGEAANHGLSQGMQATLSAMGEKEKAIFMAGFHAAQAEAARGAVPKPKQSSKISSRGAKDACGCSVGFGWSGSAAAKCTRDLGCPVCGCRKGKSTNFREAQWCNQNPCIEGDVDPYKDDGCGAGQRTCDEASAANWKTGSDFLSEPTRFAIVHQEKSFQKTSVPCWKQKGGYETKDFTDAFSMQKMCPMWSRHKQCIPVLDSWNPKYSDADNTDLIHRWCSSKGVLKKSENDDYIGVGCFGDKMAQSVVNTRKFIVPASLVTGDLRMRNSVSSLSDAMTSMTCKSKRCWKNGQCRPKCADGEYVPLLYPPNTKATYFKFSNFLFAFAGQLSSLLFGFTKVNVWKHANTWYTAALAKKMGVKSLAEAVAKQTPGLDPDPDFTARLIQDKKTKQFHAENIQVLQKRRRLLYLRILSFHFPKLFPKKLLASTGKNAFPRHGACKFMTKKPKGNLETCCENKNCAWTKRIRYKAKKEAKKGADKAWASLENLLQTHAGTDERLQSLLQGVTDVLSDENLHAHLASTSSKVFRQQKNKGLGEASAHGLKAGLWRRRRRGKGFLSGMASSAKALAKKASKAVKKVVKKAKGLAKKGLALVKSGGKAFFIKQGLKMARSFMVKHRMEDLFLVLVGTDKKPGPILNYLNGKKDSNGHKWNMVDLGNAIGAKALNGDLAIAIGNTIMPRVLGYVATLYPEYQEKRSSLQASMLRYMEILGDLGGIVDKILNVKEPTFVTSPHSWTKKAKKGGDKGTAERTWEVYAIRASQSWWKKTAQLHSQVEGNNKDKSDKKCHVYDGKAHLARDPDVPCIVMNKHKRNKDRLWEHLTNFKSAMAAANIGWSMHRNESPHVPVWQGGETKDWYPSQDPLGKGSWKNTKGAYRWGPKEYWGNQELQGGVKCMAKFVLTHDVCNTCCCRGGAMFKYNVKSSIEIEKTRYCRTWFSAMVDPFERIKQGFAASYVNSNVLSVPCYESAWVDRHNGAANGKAKPKLGEDKADFEPDDDMGEGGGKGRRGGGVGGNGGAFVAGGMSNRAGNSESMF